MLALSSLFYLIPGNADIFYNQYLIDCNNTMPLIYLDIINKRNSFYFSGVCLLFSMYMPYNCLKFVVSILFIYSMMLYIYSIRQLKLYLY